jgi:hypothetical protein
MDYATATNMVRAMADAMDVNAEVIPLSTADRDTVRAVSDCAPTVFETTPRRWWFMEQAALRAYTVPMEQALAVLDGFQVLSDSNVYDTRDHVGTCLSFEHAGQCYITRLTANEDLQKRIAASTEDSRSRLVDLRTGETIGEALDQAATMGLLAFAESRRLYAEQNEQAAAQ